MNCKYMPIPSYNAPQKQLILVDDKPFCVANKPSQASKIISFLEGLTDGKNLTDGKILKLKMKLEGKQ